MNINFKEVPEINPKTDKKTVLFLCSLCGSITVSRKIHIKWHKDLTKRMRNKIPFWDGIDNIDEENEI